MDFSINPDQRSWQMKARKFARDEIAPISLRCDQVADPRATFDWNVIEKGSKLGLRTAAVPKAWGGQELDFVTQALIMAELAKADCAISKTFSQCWKWSLLLATAGSEDQKEQFLRPFVADDRFLLGRGITEPGAGSDNRLPPEDDPKAGPRLRAERQGDAWILNGEKTFIANGGVGSVFFVDARTNPNVDFRAGTTMFIVPHDTPGFRFGKVFDKNGWRFYQNTELIFDNARVPHANVVGEINGAYSKTGKVERGALFGDLEYAATALGLCYAACEQALGIIGERFADAAHRHRQQLVQLAVNRMQVNTEALRTLALRAAWEMDQDIDAATAALAMNFAADAVEIVAEANMDIHAAAGALSAPGPEKLLRDAFTWRHIAGDSVQRMKVARRIIDSFSSSHGPRTTKDD